MLLRSPANAREVFARYDIGPAQFSQFVDGSPISASEEEVLAKILLRFSRLGLENIHRWRRPTPTGMRLPRKRTSGKASCSSFGAERNS